MILATCRASILRAASTSSSWAAQKGIFEGVYGKKCGPRMREQRENIQTLELRVHILSITYALSITLMEKGARIHKTKMEILDVVLKKKSLHEHTNEPGARFTNRVICSLPTHLEFLSKCSGVGLSQVRLQILQGIVTLRQAFWQDLFGDTGLQWALCGKPQGHQED